MEQGVGKENPQEPSFPPPAKLASMKTQQSLSMFLKAMSPFPLLS